MTTGPLCAEISPLLQAHADGDLSAEERNAVEAHLEGCASCAREDGRLRGNGEYLREVWSPFRMPAEFPSEFLFALPKKGARQRAAVAAAAAPRTVVMGATASRGFPWLAVLVGTGFLAGAGGLAWLFLRPGTPVRQGSPVRDLPDVKPREVPGKGAADGRTPRDGGRSAPKEPRKGEPPPRKAWEPLLTGADLVAALRAQKGTGFGPAISRGWDLLAGSPKEAPAVREAAAAEKEPGVRAALVLCLGADGSEENRVALRGFLPDPAPEVRTAAALGLGRSLSFDEPAKRSVTAGPPLGLSVQVGALADDPGRSELASRLVTESEPSVRAILVQVLAATAGADTEVRDRLLDGVKGAYGDELRLVCMTALTGLRDPSLVPPLAEVLASAGTPDALRKPILDAMLLADGPAAVEAIAGLLPSADGAEFRKSLIQAIGRNGGARAESALVQALSGDPEASVRMAAILALQRFPSREVLNAMESAANGDADQMVRVEAERVAQALRPAVERAEGATHEAPPPDDPPPPPDGGEVVR